MNRVYRADLRNRNLRVQRGQKGGHISTPIGCVSAERVPEAAKILSFKDLPVDADERLEFQQNTKVKRKREEVGGLAVQLWSLASGCKVGVVEQRIVMRTKDGPVAFKALRAAEAAKVRAKKRKQSSVANEEEAAIARQAVHNIMAAQIATMAANEVPSPSKAVRREASATPNGAGKVQDYEKARDQLVSLKFYEKKVL